MACILQSYDAPLGLSGGSLSIMKFWSGMQTKAHILYFPKEKLGVKF